MIEVQYFKLVLRIECIKVGCKSVRVHRVANEPDVVQHPTLEHAQKGVLVPLVDLRYEASQHSSPRQVRMHLAMREVGALT